DYYCQSYDISLSPVF
nr:immunoglobulin light chain junction region [Macaca mulatta]